MVLDNSDIEMLDKFFVTKGDMNEFASTIGDNIWHRMKPKLMKIEKKADQIEIKADMCHEKIIEMREECDKRTISCPHLMTPEELKKRRDEIQELELDEIEHQGKKVKKVITIVVACVLAALGGAASVWVALQVFGG